MRFCFNKYGLIPFALFVTSLSGCSAGYDTAIDCYSTVQFRKQLFPSFSAYMMNVRSESESRIDIYLQIAYKNLRFEQSADGYKASYSISFIIRNIDKEIIQTKELERAVNAKTYEESISSRSDGLLQSFVLKPSEYIIDIITVDHLSQLRCKESTRIVAKRFSDSTITASTLLLLDTVIIDGKGISLRPVFPGALSRLDDSFGIFQELYNVNEGDTVKIIESFSKPTMRDAYENSFVYFTPPYRIENNACREGVDSVYMRMDSTFIITKKDVRQLIQFYPLPASGYNYIHRDIIVTRNLKSDTIRFRNNYFLRDRALQTSLSFREITNAMRYILREAEYDSISIAHGEDRNKQLNQFWVKHGGLDRRKEFEKRIHEANTLFTGCTNGAETTMGIVFIICGIPDYIECRGGSIETWFYTIGERSFPVQFRREDENNAEYVLFPFSVNDALWQYFVDRWRRK